MLFQHNSTLQATEEYIRIDKYVRQHLDQRTVMAEFVKIVRNILLSYTPTVSTVYVPALTSISSGVQAINIHITLSANDSSWIFRWKIWSNYMKEKRKFPRKMVKLSMVISHPALGQIIGHVRNMSESGVFLDVYRSGLFECGQVVGANIIDSSGIDIDPPLSMEVMRVELSGIALKFVEVSEEIVLLKALSAHRIESQRQLNELSPADGDA